MKNKEEKEIKSSIYKDNDITPSKKPIVNWSYTTSQQGKKIPFKFPESDSAIKRMKAHVNCINRWNSYPGPHPEGHRNSRKYTTVTIIPTYDNIKIHSLFFPDGTVWDSTTRSFRKIKDYERKDGE